MERNFCQKGFFKLSKRNLTHECFITLQLSRSVRLRRKWSLGEKKKRRKQHYDQKRKQIRYLNILHINILSLLCADAKSVMLLYAISCCYIFPDGSVWLMDILLCFCDVWKGRSYVNSNVSVSSVFNNGQFYLKCYFLCHRNPLLKEI